MKTATELLTQDGKMHVDINGKWHTITKIGNSGDIAKDLEVKEGGETRFSKDRDAGGKVAVRKGVKKE